MAKIQTVAPEIYTEHELLHGSNITVETIPTHKAYLLKAILKPSIELDKILKDGKFRLLLQRL